MLKGPLKYVIDFFAGRKILQPFFEMLYKMGVYGMNYNRSGAFNKTGEITALQYIKRRLAGLPTLTLFDVGGNRGDYAMAMVRVFQGFAYNIFCFEPSRSRFELIKKTLGNTKNIFPFNIGLGDKNQHLTLYSPDEYSGLASLYHRRLEHAGIQMDCVETVSLQTLDGFCEENGIQEIDFLKLDIEGYEYKCLEGAKELLKKKKVKFIQFEFGGTNIDSRTYFQDFWYLLHDNFNFYRIVHDGLVPIRKYNERSEIFKNINFLAELKSFAGSNS